ncbi:MAG: hypothetical protein N2C14_19025, partial [Planctomycetales bacterium]
MTRALRALLTDSIDYAGLFPPAELSLEESARNHARYLKEPEAWMLGRFVCPASRLDELNKIAGELSSGDPWRVTVVATKGNTDRLATMELPSLRIQSLEISFLMEGREVIWSLRKTLKTHGGENVISYIEFPLPVDQEDWLSIGIRMTQTS